MEILAQVLGGILIVAYIAFLYANESYIWEISFLLIWISLGTLIAAYKRNTNRSLQNQKKKNLSILWKLIWMIIIWTMDWQRHQRVHRKGVTQI